MATASKPVKKVMKLPNGLHAALYRASRGRIANEVAHLPVLLITTIGRKSGRPHTNPVVYLRDGQDYLVSATVGGIRAWMVVLALQFGERPHFTWKGTFGGILLPAAVVGALLGTAASARAPSTSKRSNWVVLSPLLLVLGPAIFTAGLIPTLIDTGVGDGSVGVALTGMSAGYALSGTGPRWLRRAAGVLAVLLGVGPGVGFAFVGRGSTGTPNRVLGGLLFALLMALLVAAIGASTRERSS